MINLEVPEWAYAYGGPSGSGDIKTIPDDFFVEEILSFQPEGSGEHVFLFIEKIGENTEYIARLLARHARVRQRDVSFAGMKDRHGRTRQWFSVWLPGKAEPDWSVIENDQLKILRTIRHARKLKRGVLEGNQFELVIRNCQASHETLEQQLQRIKTQGFPNYFGEQRFGRNGNNIHSALAMFQGKRVKPEQRTIYLSAVRAFLFNHILAERVRQNTWNQALPGDVLQLNLSHSYFAAPHVDQEINKRISEGDIHPTGALWGKGECGQGGLPLLIEQSIIAQYAPLGDGLIKAGLEADRRSLRCFPEMLSWDFSPESHLKMSFRLTAGSYATALIREILKTQV